MDIGLRCIDIMLGVENNVVFDFSDVLCNRCNFADAIVECEQQSNLFYIPAPENLNFYYDIDKIKQYIKKLKNVFDVVIVDMPAGLIGPGIGVLSQENQLFDMILIITTPDPVCMRDSQKMVLILEESRYKNYRLIINLVEKQGLKKSKIKDLDMVIDAVGAQLIGVITYDSEYKLSLAEGKFLDQKHVFNKVFSAISKRIDGEYIPLIIDKI